MPANGLPACPLLPDGRPPPLPQRSPLPPYLRPAGRTQSSPLAPPRDTSSKHPSPCRDLPLTAKGAFSSSSRALAPAPPGASLSRRGVSCAVNAGFDVGGAGEGLKEKEAGQWLALCLLALFIVKKLPSALLLRPSSLFLSVAASLLPFFSLVLARCF